VFVSRTRASQSETGEHLADDALRHERGDVRRPDSRRDHLDDVGRRQVDARGDLAHGPEEIDGRHSARLRRSRPRRERRVEHVDVDGQVDGPLPDVRERALDHLADPELPDVVHEERRNPAFALPPEFGRPGPVAAEADLRVARAGDRTGLDEPEHRRPVRALDAEHLAARVGVRVEVDQPERPAARRDRRGAGLGDRMVAAERQRDDACVDDLADQPRDRRVRMRRVGGQHRRVAVVDDAQLRERVDARFEVRAGRARRGADRARREPRPRAVGHEIVHRRADDRDVDALEVRGLLRDRRTAEGEKARVVGLVRQRPPAGERVDRHARSPPTIVAVTSRSAAPTAAASSGSRPSTQPVSTSSSAP
jgi:hypothetical protein